MAYQDLVVAQGPVAYYRMGDTSGTTMVDSSGAGLNGTYANSPTKSVAGALANNSDTAVTFNGSNQNASATVSTDSGSAASAVVWIKGTKTSGDQYIVGKWGSATLSQRWVISFTDASNGRPFVYIRASQSGTYFNVSSTTDVLDGNWHMLAFTYNGSTLTLYVDGVSAGTTSVTGLQNSNGALTIGSSASSTNYFNGSVDEVAVFNKSLSSGTISSLYLAAKSASVAATPMTASVSTPDAVGGGNVAMVPVLHDAEVRSANATTNYGNAVVLGPSSYIRTDTYSAPSGMSETKRELWLHDVDGTNFYFGTVNATWDEATITWNNKPSVTYIPNGSTNYPSVSRVGEWVVFNITGLDGTNGFFVQSGDFGWAPDSSEAANTGNRPHMRVTTMPQASVSVNAGPFTESALMPNASVSTSGNASVGANVLVTTAVMVNPSVSAEQFIDREVQAAPMEATAAFQTGQGFSLPVTVAALPLEASGTAPDASVSVQRGPRVAAQPFTATASWKKPALVNGNPIAESEAEDRYFQRVFGEAPKTWFRLDDKGSTAADRMGGLGGVYHGVIVGQYNGPDNRHSVYFNGSASIEQNEPGGTNDDEKTTALDRARTTVEFTFRTTKANSFLMVSRDQIAGSAGTQWGGSRELYLKDGKIVMKNTFLPNNQGKVRDPYEFSGFRNIADGQYHHVILKGYLNRFGEEGVEIWVDGKLEVRRVDASGAEPFHGFPDWIGSRPDTIDGHNIGALPSSWNFVGDMTEVVFYSYIMSDHNIPRHYYDVMGWRPIEAQPMEASMTATEDNRGRGNQKRALYLYWKAKNEMYSIGGDPWPDEMNFNPFIGLVQPFDPYKPGVQTPVGDYNGYKVFAMPITIRPDGKPYRDPVTDAQTLIDLEHDIDLQDFDVIAFRDWPDEGWELDEAEFYWPGAKERLVNQIAKACQQGIGLLVTHPRLAVDLGIIDRVEFVETMKERAFNGNQGNAFGNYDYGSAIKFPWNIAGSSGLEGHGKAGSIYNGQPMNTDPTFLSNKAFFYEDMNFVNRFRVRALVEGLTDIPSYMIQDAVYQTDMSAWGWRMSAFKYLHRLNGLQIGDEFIFHGTNAGGGDWGDWDFNGYRIGRPLGYYATPLANVKTGTVITTFGATLWQGKSLVTSPYKDYATTIVVQPGDALKGVPILGKVFVSFTEQPSWQPDGVPVQVLPPDNELPANYIGPDTPAQKEWEWSDTRKSLYTTGNPVTGTVVNVTMPDGSIMAITTVAAGNNLQMTRSSNVFPIEYYPSWHMTRRGIYWLGNRAEVEPGSVTVNATPMEAFTDSPAVTVVAERDAHTNAEIMSAVAVMPKVAEDETGDAQILTLPMTLTATFTNYGKTIAAEPMLLTAELVENEDMVRAAGEQVVLYLHGVDAELYLKEEA